MASTNQSPFYQRAEEEYNKASNDEERIACLEIMIKECPKHKSSENMLKNLTLRLKKLKSNVSKQKKSGKGGEKGLKKMEVQCILAGFPNVGKTSVFNSLTGLSGKVTQYQFTTFRSKPGIFWVLGASVQIVDIPAFPSHDKNLLNSTDTLIIVIDSLDQIKKSEEFIYRSRAKVIYLYNKVDLLNETGLRKLKANLKSKHKNKDVLFFNKDATKGQIDKLKASIFSTFPVIRVYTKEPKKDPSKDPMILPIHSTFKTAVEKILKGMSAHVKKARVWGPSSKFGGQIIGLDHELRDKDVIEFQTN